MMFSKYLDFSPNKKSVDGAETSSSKAAANKHKGS